MEGDLSTHAASLPPVPRSWSSFLGGWRINALTKIDLDEWVTQLVNSPGYEWQGKRRKHTPRAIQQAVAVVQAMLSAAVDSKVIRENPARRVLGPATAAREERWFTRDEVDAILRELEPRWATLVETAVWCGLR